MSRETRKVPSAGQLGHETKISLQPQRSSGKCNDFSTSITETFGCRLHQKVQKKKKN